MVFDVATREGRGGRLGSPAFFAGAEGFVLASQQINSLRPSFWIDALKSPYEHFSG